MHGTGAIQRIAVALLCTVCSQLLIAQNSGAEKLVHQIKAGIGIGTSRYFSGFAGTLSYEVHRRNYFALVSVNHLLEFQIFPQQLQHETDLSLTLNRAFHRKWFEISGGTGIAYTRHLFDIYNVYKPAPGTFVPDEYRYIKKGGIGLPADVQLTGNFNRLTVSVASHSNFNSINTMHCFYMARMGLRFR